MHHIEAMAKARTLWGDNARCRVTTIVLDGGAVRFDYEIGYWRADGESRWWGGPEGNWESCFTNYSEHGEAVQDITK